MGSRLRLRERHVAIAIQRRVVVHAAVRIEHTAVTVVGELVEAEIALHDQGVTDLGDGDARRDIENALRIGRAGADGVLVLGHPEEHHAADAGLGGAVQSRPERVRRMLHDTRH